MQNQYEYDSKDEAKRKTIETPEKQVSFYLCFEWLTELAMHSFKIIFHNNFLY